MNNVCVPACVRTCVRARDLHAGLIAADAQARDRSQIRRVRRDRRSSDRASTSRRHSAISEGAAEGGGVTKLVSDAGHLKA